MEEDIKILEEICNRPIQDTEGTKIMKQAIENLIKAYKNLEQIEQVHKETNGELRKRITELEENNSELNKGIKRLKDKNKELSNELIDVKVDKVTKNYIPKSKVKEKIKEVNQEFDKKNTSENNEWYIDSEIYGYATQVLQELLEQSLEG